MRKLKLTFFIVLLLISSIVTLEMYLLNEFVKTIRTLAPHNPPRADVIICLTGDSKRIPESFQLLDTRKAEKLFLSGVNKEVSLDDILQILTMNIPEDMLKNIVIDKSSINTYDNAKQSLLYLQNEGYHSIILLTSNYHMVRALYMFQKVFPKNITIYPYPINAPDVQLELWWEDANSRKIILSEFIKYSWYKFWLELIG